MKLRVDGSVFALAPKVKIGVCVVEGMDNSGRASIGMDSFLEKLREKYPLESLASIEQVVGWRDVFKSFGAKPKKTPASIEALLKRVLAGGSLPSINALVDLYNYISLKYLVPVGAEDLDKITGDVALIRASGEERFIPIGESDEKPPKQGEVVYVDNEKVLCRRWNWRESEESKITAETSRCIVVIEDIVGDNIEAALQEFGEKCKQVFGVGVRFAISSVEGSVVDLDTMEISEPIDVSAFAVEEKTVEKKKEKKKKDKGENRKQDLSGPLHWADQTARRVLDFAGDRDVITCAAGITPSGKIHIGNFREIITVELIARALQKATDKKVRFIYSWDDFDVFRKVPPNMPQQEMLAKYLRYPIVEVPDPFGEEESYARRNEVDVEKHMPTLGVHPEYIYQHGKYRNCDYAEGIKKALEHVDVIKEILNQHRKEPLPDTWSPARVFCEKCHKDEDPVITHNGGYSLSYTCSCGHSDTFDFREKGIAKLGWRVDWPMRWEYEGVVFEPGGKDHSSDGGSYDTGKEIAKKVYDIDAPLYIMYDFVRIKGAGGKISSSKGDVITVKEVLDVYEPMIVRWLFAGTRPNTEFAISFDQDVIKIYEDFDKCERIYYGTQEAKNEKEKVNQSRIYELSCIKPEAITQKPPYQASFRHLTTIVQICEHNINKVLAHYKKNEGITVSDAGRLRTRAACASHWLKNYAPDDMVFHVNEEKPEIAIDELLVPVVRKFHELLNLDDQKAIEEGIYNYCKENNISLKDFFGVAYQLLISKTKGPKLVPFIFNIGKEKVRHLFDV